MFDKLFEAQQQAEEIKKRLDQISVTSEIENGGIKVVASANKEIKEISFSEDFFTSVDKEGLEELLVVALNKVMEQADNVSQSEMQAATKNMLGGLGNLFGNG